MDEGLTSRLDYYLEKQQEGQLWQHDDLVRAMKYLMDYYAISRAVK